LGYWGGRQARSLSLHFERTTPDDEIEDIVKLLL
jgi:hypothetical protein